VMASESSQHPSPLSCVDMANVALAVCSSLGVFRFNGPAPARVIWSDIAGGLS